MQLKHLVRTAFALTPLVGACSATSTEPAPAQGVAHSPSAPSATPLRDGARFSSTISHPYLPLSTARYAVLESDDEKVIREVLDQPKIVAGVECLVLAEKEYEDGELQEISYNYWAQDEHGNVYYFGEDVDDYEDDQVVSHGGAWLVGRNAEEPCLFLPARLEIGLRYKPENSPPAAEEWAEIDTVEASLKVPAGAWEAVLVVKESDHSDRWEERKYYARGIGLISENRELNLVTTRKPE